jgi:hypothetical protein
MRDLRIIFSPMTADPAYLQHMAATMAAAQWQFAQVAVGAVFSAQIQVMRSVGEAMLTAQRTVLDTACQAAFRPG